MKKAPTGTTSAIMQGQAGVHRVAAELLLRGLVPYTPSVDAGVDLVVNGAIRIQVKSTHGASRHWRHPEGTFSFSLTKAQRIVGREYEACAARLFSGDCDFVVLCSIYPVRYWIVPAHVLDGRHTICFGETPQWVPVDIAEAERLRSQGWTWNQLAEKFKSAPRTIRRRLDGSYAEPKQHYANILNYENRWDLIAGAESMLREANQLVARPLTAGSVTDTLAARE